MYAQSYEGIQYYLRPLHNESLSHVVYAISVIRLRKGRDSSIGYKDTGL